MDKTEKKSIILKMSFIISVIMFAVPSLLYYLKNKTIFKFEPYFQFLLNNTDRVEQTIIYIAILAIMTILYFLLIKNRENIFKNTKKMFIFIILVSIIFIMVIPFTCSDVFYYLGIGKLDGKYSQNPYYTSIKEFVEQNDNSKLLEEDTVLAQGYINDWAGATVVYGPVWTFICRIVATLSFGNIDIGLLVFKLINLFVHILNCYLIYKITNKKIFTLIYGINPFILIEGIACVHNDIFVLLFSICALYFLIKKKKILISLFFLAMATAIKYFTILFLPIILIYYFQKERPIKRLLKCIEYGMIFLLILGLFYLLYIKDLSVFSGLFTQQEKLAKSIYIMISEYFNNPPNLVTTINKTLLYSFIIIYFFYCVVLLNKKNIKIKKEMQNLSLFIMIFIFLLITNFQPWYIMWLFISFMWQKPRMLKLIIQIALISEFANSIFLIYGEGWRYGTPFIFTMLLGTTICIILNQQNRRKMLWKS